MKTGISDRPTNRLPNKNILYISTYFFFQWEFFENYTQYTRVFFKKKKARVTYVYLVYPKLEHYTVIFT